MSRIVCGTLLALAMAFSSSARADQPDSKKAGANVKVEKVFRASTIKGMGVYNLAGDRVGTVDDLVIDVEKGQVVYAALSVGGFLGVGDKLFAIPWREFTLEMGEDGKFFRVDITKEKLKAAKGFDKDAWPNVADPQWREEIESQYKERNATTTKTKTTTTTRRARD
jgi:sporulation protein YlmC with PRC-barrel domain